MKKYKSNPTNLPCSKQPRPLASTLCRVASCAAHHECIRSRTGQLISKTDVNNLRCISPSLSNTVKNNCNICTGVERQEQEDK